MDKGILQRYSTWAKENLENQIEVSLKALGINDDNDIKKAKQVGDITTIEGDPTSYPAELYNKRERIIDLVKRSGYKNVIEEFAYTWFNRFVALRFMEVHGFLPHGFRVLSNPTGGIEPEILKNLNLVKDDLKVDMNLCTDYKQQGKIEELFRHVLIRQCNSLAEILPMLFSTDMGYLELLLPTNLLKGETVITKLNEIPEELFLEDVEAIGWMYQFYVSDKRQEYRDAKLVTKELIPTLTQVFTADWIVRYMAENSVGRLWLESYPNSSLRTEMKYYVEDAEQTEGVQKKIDEIKYKNVNPEDIRIIEPCCGSGHILVYIFDLLVKMYEERGYQKRDIPTLILKNNLTGLDVDKRAAQLASFSLIMKARSVNNRFFSDQYYEVPHVYEIKDSALLKEMGYHKHLSDMNLLTDEELSLIEYLVDTFKNAKTIGSLLKVRPIDVEFLSMAFDKISKNAVSNLFNFDFMNEGMKRLGELMNLAKILSSKYDVMITNPPYLSSSKLEAKAKEYAIREFPISKIDMSAMFMEVSLVKQNGFRAMVTPDSWMFIGSYQKFRNQLVGRNTLICQHSMDFGTFDAMVQTTTFVMRNTYIDSYVTEFQDAQNKKYYVPTKLFGNIPSESFSYWISSAVLKVFEKAIVDTYCVTREGMTTANNDGFLRLWHEIDFNKTTLSPNGDKWFPYLKGGEYRKWYGNHDYLVNWENDGIEIKNFKDLETGRIRSHNYNGEWGLKEGFSWSEFSSSELSIRYSKGGFLFDTKGCMGFANGTVEIEYIMALYNSCVGKEYTKIFCATTDYKPGQLIHIPLIISVDYRLKVIELVRDNIAISETDWNSFENSWDFNAHPLVLSLREKDDALITQFAASRMEKLGLISWHYNRWADMCQARFASLKENEEELNRLFIEIYGLQDELTPEVVDKDVTVRLADKERDVRSLISYLIGVAMGRYSIDVPGLAYAGGEWDASKYISYQPDDDGIIPIYNSIGMEDGLTTVLIKLIKHIYGEDTYRENIDFIAEALGKKNSESSEETLNRYLNDGFYKNHLKVYQKRPIYWMFTSGDNSGFKCLVYMHRYNEDTLARINSKYYLPESTRKKNELEELNGKIAHAEGRDRVKYEKERQNLSAAYQEAIEYGQVLDHMANKYISIDLDDGVKENYSKFQSIEVVTDGGSKVKKDLLAPLK